MSGQDVDAVVKRLVGIVVDYLELGHMPGTADHIVDDVLLSLKPGDRLPGGLRVVGVMSDAMAETTEGTTC